MPFTPLQRLRELGPGLILAAAGIGAGDVVVASVTGAKFGYLLLWALLATCLLKYALTEALSRWQLATGETVVRAWFTRLPRWVGIYFWLYLVMWTFLVGAALSSACGLAAASLAPQLSAKWWGAIHGLGFAGLVALNRYSTFQKIMKLLIAAMAACVIGSAIALRPPVADVATGLVWPRLPLDGGPTALLSLLGGIGGSLTVVCYAYWLREEKWTTADKLREVRADVRLAYLFTAIFGVALVITAAGLGSGATGGTGIALNVAARVGEVLGPIGRIVYLIGFWCTVCTATLGVWQGVPHVWVDAFAARQRGRAVTPERQRRICYLVALAFIAGPPLVLLWFHRPVAVVIGFTVVGAFFMPFLAATLLYLNNRRDWMGALANRRLGNAALAVSLLAFGAVCVRQLVTLTTD